MNDFAFWSSSHFYRHTSLACCQATASVRTPTTVTSASGSGVRGRGCGRYSPPNSSTDWRASLSDSSTWWGPNGKGGWAVEGRGGGGGVGVLNRDWKGRGSGMRMGRRRLFYVNECRLHYDVYQLPYYNNIMLVSSWLGHFASNCL